MSDTATKSAPDASGRPAPAATITIFGAAGDLTKRLVVPALYNLARAGRLPSEFSIIGIDHNALNTAAWRQSLTDEMQNFVQKGGGEFQAGQINKQTWEWLLSRAHYLRGDFTDPGAYRELKALVAGYDNRPEAGGNILFYLATADRFFCQIIKQLGSAGLAVQSQDAWRRVIIEKPFGHDFHSARALNEGILQILSEDQIYRIDHFLGKEPVQNILVLRFANGIFEPMWNRDHIDHVQITVAETVGVEERGRFYERTGALRDMVPNHLFQLLAMIAIEPPASFDANSVRRKKTELFQAIRPIPPADAVRGQYGGGTVLGRPVKAYRQEPDVAPDSPIETYVALKLGIDNWRWAGVPFYLRTGKHLPARSTEIAIQFRQAPYALFRKTPIERLPANILTLRIQPDEGLSFSFSAKRPGPEIEIDGVAMNFSYRDYFEPLAAVGYETLIYDCLNGDASLFQRADTVEAAWYIVQGLIDAWASSPAPRFPNYDSGSAGPEQANGLIARDGRAWLPIGRAKPRMER
jgi:glucose-6-phosphate 1-dehydrogenase